MTIEERVEDIKERFKNNNFKLSDEDIFACDYSEELLNILLYYATNNANAITEEFLDIAYSKNLFEKIKKEDLPKFFKNYLQFMLLSNQSSLDFFDYEKFLYLSNYLGIDDKTADTILEEVTTLFGTEKNIKINRCYNSTNNFDYMLNLLLDYKRYDLIKTLYFDHESNGYLSVTDETLTRFFKTYPLGIEDLPEFIFNVKDWEKYLDYFTINDLITLYYREDPKKIRRLIYEKVKNTESFADYPLKNILFLFPNDEELAMELYKKDSFVGCEKLINNKIITFPEVEERLLELSKNHKLSARFFPMSYAFSYTNKELLDYMISHGIFRPLFFTCSITDEIRNRIELSLLDLISKDEFDTENLPPFDTFKYQNKDLKKCMISKGIIRPLIKSDSLTDEDYDLIIDEINNNNPLYDEFCRNPLRNVPEKVLEAIINRGLIESFSNYSIKDLYNNNRNLFYLLLEKNRNLFITLESIDILDNNKLVNNKILKILIDRGSYDEIIFNLNKVKDLDYLYDYVISNHLYSFAKSLYNSSPQIVLDNDYLLNFFINDEHLYKTLLKRLEDYPNLDEYYTDYLYNGVKKYYIRDNNINPLHLDRLEKLFGPRIIRYLNNDNIIDIANLDNKYFDRFISLFDKVKPFDMQDLNGALVSLNEKIFPSQNLQIVNIFSEMKNAYKNNDEVLLDNLLLVLELGLSSDVVKKLRNDNIESKEELISYLHECLNEKNSLNFLHDVCDLFLEGERAKFLNNSYFEKEYHFKEYHDSFIKNIKNNDYYNAYLDMLVLFKKNKPRLEFVTFLDKMQNKEIDQNDLRILQKIYDDTYEHYSKEYHSHVKREKELKLPFNYNETQLNKILKKDIFVNCRDYELERDGKKENLYDILNIMFNNETLDKAIKTMNGYQDGLNKRELGEVLKSYNKLIEGNNLFYKGNPYNRKAHICLIDDYLLDNAKDYYPGEPSISICDLLSNINVKLMKENLLDDENAIKDLKSILNNKKILGMPEVLKRKFREANIDDDYNNLAYFISNYKNIIEREEKREKSRNREFSINSLTVPKVMELSGLFSNNSSVFSTILGPEDAKLIKSNPGKNQAYKKIEHNQRLIESVEYTKSNFMRKYVTVPPIDKIYDLGDGIKINCIVGNFTDPCVLTLGERTESCMRIGGVGESLYDFCLKNINGFHIVFEDPETHEVITRVSGFRNGKPVFLNELRHSNYLEKYPTEKIDYALELVCKDMIKISKESKYPIDIVAINSAYGYVADDKLINLNVRNIQKGFDKFYFDTGSIAVVVATSSEDGTFKELELNKDQAPLYEVQRGKTIEYLDDFKKAKEKIQRIDAIKQLLEGKDYKNIDIISFEKEPKYVIANDDFYIMVDETNKIISDCLNDDRARKEYEETLERVKEKYTDKSHTK